PGLTGRSRVRQPVQRVIGEPALHVGLLLVGIENDRVLISGNGLVEAVREKKRETERVVGHAVQRVELPAAPCGGDARVRATHEDGKAAVESQYPRVSRLECQGVFVRLARAGEIECA